MDADGRERQTKSDKLSQFLQSNKQTEQISLFYLDELPPAMISNDKVREQKLENYLKMKVENGFNLTENIKTHKDFGNPQVKN